MTGLRVVIKDPDQFDRSFDSLPMSKTEANTLPAPAFEDSKHHIKIYQGDCLEILAKIPEETVDLVFADPPYFLSNGGITCHRGRMVSVNKGEWDKLPGGDGPVRARYEKVHGFNRAVPVEPFACEFRSLWPLDCFIPHRSPTSSMGVPI